MVSSKNDTGNYEPEEDFDLEDSEDLNEKYKNCLIVHNMTVVADTGVNFNLGESHIQFGNSIYEPQEFNCIRLDVRIKKEYDSTVRLDVSKEFENISHIQVVEATKGFGIPAIIKKFHIDRSQNCELHKNFDPKTLNYTSVKVSVFPNGKLSVTGARSLLSATIALEKVCRAIRRRINEKARLFHINCSNILVVYPYPHQVILPLFHKACKGSTYDPLRFSGVRLRVPIQTPQVFYDLFKVLHMTNFSTKYSHLIKDENENQDESQNDDQKSDEFESDEELVPPVPIHNLCVPKTTKKFRTSKFGIQRFVDSAVSDKRKIHHSTGQVVVKKKKTVLPKNVTIWTNTNLLTKETEDLIDPLVKVEDTMNNLKEEVVTINVFSSGNVTFTGARSIPSIQKALSHIYPFLEYSKRKT